MLEQVKEGLHTGDVGAGFMQTAFIISYMIFAPVFGYMGDRYNRKYIMTFGVFIWSLMTFIGSFMTVNINIFNFTKYSV